MRGFRDKRIVLLAVCVFLILAGSLGRRIYVAMQRDRTNHALMAALRRHDTPAVLTALNAGADPNFRDDHTGPLSVWQQLFRLIRPDRPQGVHSARPGITALSLALSDFNLEAARLLVAKGANVNARNLQAQTPLLEVLERAFRRWDMGGDDPPPPPYPPCAKLLIEAGADVNARDWKGTFALYRAAQLGDAETVHLLLDRGAEVNARTTGGFTPLFVAASSGNPLVVKLLLGRGADVKIKDTEGQTALQMARQDQASPEILRLLKRADAGE